MSNTGPLSAETIKNFLYASTATVSMQMMKRGFRNCAIGGVRPLNPKATRLVGPAYTLRYIPSREDLDKPPTPADPPSAQRRAIEETPAGHVLVIGTEGNTRSGTLGDILALRLKVRGVAGVLSDGAMRDTPVIGKFDWPVYCTAAAAPPKPIDDIVLPPFTEPLFPSALAGGREGLHEQSLPVLDAVAHEARACTKCDLCRTRTNAVPGIGSARSGIVFVGEAPGADEDERGEPFVGRAGELLTRMIAAMDEKQLIPGVKLDREHVFIVNVLKCRPPENRNPMPNEIDACSPYLLRQLEALKPRVICCLGKFAADLLLQTKNTTIASMRGRTYRWRGAKLIVTYHPAYCLRSPSAKRPVWDDLQRLAQEYLAD